MKLYSNKLKLYLEYRKNALRYGMTSAWFPQLVQQMRFAGCIILHMCKKNASVQCRTDLTPVPRRARHTNFI
jgi:hypothetical protein